MFEYAFWQLVIIWIMPGLLVSVLWLIHSYRAYGHISLGELAGALTMFGLLGWMSVFGAVMIGMCVVMDKISRWQGWDRTVFGKRE